MHKLTGPTWFEQFRGEKTRTDAMARLVAASGISLHTLYKAFVAARPIRADVATRLGQLEGAENLDVSSLTLPDANQALERRHKRASSDEPAPPAKPAAKAKAPAPPARGRRGARR